MAERGVEKARLTQARSLNNQRMPRPLRCAERRSHCHASGNCMARKYLKTRSIPVAAGLGLTQQKSGSRNRDSARITGPPPGTSRVALTPAPATLLGLKPQLNTKEWRHNCHRTLPPGASCNLAHSASAGWDYARVPAPDALLGQWTPIILCRVEHHLDHAFHMAVRRPRPCGFEPHS